ncbi:MAG: glycosyltransferase family 4 protein [bacterium]|nr:glycosyltransferase family 4 protein [bacterium]
MRIGFDISKVLGVSDGIANYSRSLLRELIRIGAEDQFLLFDLRQPEIDRDRCVEVLPDLPPNTNVVSDRGPEPGELDVFMCPAFKVPELESVPLVYTVHDVTFVSHPQFHTLYNRVEVLSETVTALLRDSALLAVSEATRSEISAWFGVEPSRISVVYEAAHVLYAPPAQGDPRPEILQRLGVDRPYVLSVGSIEPRKNLRGLLQAFSSLDSSLRDTHALVVVGAAGWRNEAIHRHMSELADRLDVSFAGALQLPDLVALYGHAAVFAYPSFAEGFGLPVLEAMACGTPVVTSNRSSMVEVAANAARLVNPEDPVSIRAALAELLQDDSVCNRLRKLGLERAAEFSWSRAAEETLTLLRREGYRRRSTRGTGRPAE